MTMSHTVCEIEQRFVDNITSIVDELRLKPMPITLVNFRDKYGQNIFHFLVNDAKILKRFYSNYSKYIDQFDDKDDKKRMQEVFLLILCPNNKDQSPFDISMKKNPVYVELLLKMLSVVPDYMLSRFIFKDLSVFIELMGMEISVFDTFLDQCYFQTLSM